MTRVPRFGWLLIPLTLGAAMPAQKKIQIFNPATSAAEEVEPIVKSDAEWQRILTPEQYEVLRRRGTERPFSRQCAIPLSGKGVYACAACGTALFAYGHKFESGTGWPSFWDPVSPLNVKLHRDVSHGMAREEVVCARCGSHLGHVFDDGPPPTGKRYCINAVALALFKEAPAGGAAAAGRAAGGTAPAIATFAGGCFWGMEKAFGELPGVLATRVGYTGGTVTHPTYEMVCTGRTGHAEAIEVTHDPARISYEELLEFFFTHHDPTTLNRQGNDVGTQYRSAIFPHTPEQQAAAERAKAALAQAGAFQDPVVTTIEPAGEFFPAEASHQKYLQKNPHGYCDIQLQPTKVREALRAARQPAARPSPSGR